MQGQISLMASVLLCAIGTAAMAQHTGYSLKAGASVATQKWNEFEQDPLIGYHIDLQVESISDDAPRTLYASLGIHQRGSAIRTQRREFVDPRTRETIFVPRTTIPFVFTNAVLALGGKQYYPLGNQLNGHVALALRGEYNVATDFGGESANLNYGYGALFPVDAFVNDWVYGIDFGGGIDFPMGPMIDGLVELRISPDVSQQYFQPPIRDVLEPFTGNNTTLRERSIRNLTLELSLGIRLLRYAPEVELD